MRAVVLALLTLTACKGGGEPTPVCTEAAEMVCVDEMILDLSLQEEVSDGAVTNTADGDGWITTFDASAGGMNEASNNPWLYLRFTDTGAEAVAIDDETALTSMDWHLSARRFILRLNGGSSGPSCVGAASLPEADYATLAEVPEGLSFRTDDYYTSDCTIINDSSGLPGSPQVALAPWWSYDGCVKTTGAPFLIQLESGRVIKLVVDSYYGEGQDDCNASGSPGSGSAEFSIRWAFVQ